MCRCSNVYVYLPLRRQKLFASYFCHTHTRTHVSMPHFSAHIILDVPNCIILLIICKLKTILCIQFEFLSKRKRFKQQSCSHIHMHMHEKEGRQTMKTYTYADIIHANANTKMPPNSNNNNDNHKKSQRRQWQSIVESVAYRVCEQAHLHAIYVCQSYSSSSMY